MKLDHLHSVPRCLGRVEGRPDIQRGELVGAFIEIAVVVVNDVPVTASNIDYFHVNVRD